VTQVTFQKTGLLNVLELPFSPKDNIKMDLQEVGWGHGMD
jgi:hypothetical protein